MSTRRRLLTWAHLACRLPLLILWTLIVLLILFMLLDSNPAANIDQLESKVERHQQIEPIQRITRQDDRHRMLTPTQLLVSSSRVQNQQYESTHRTDIFPIAKPGPNIKRPAWAPSSTTTKSPTSDYARQGEIFILIVQDQDSSSKIIHARRDKQYSQAKSNNLYPTSSSASASSNLKQASSSDNLNDQQRKLIVPSHIRQLIEILDAHRIGYTIETSRHGLPTKLLEANNKRTGRRYSVIVIDDFIKYTKLNRWLRDQLDRYCRSNRIGVVTYLVDNHKLDHYLASTVKKSPMHKFSSGQRDPVVSDNHSDRMERTMTDQFPLTFEPIEQNCHNLSSSNCLVDYQLNGRSQILRILKNKEEFIIRGELAASDSPIMTMFTNHITYEPLTWARLREPSFKSLHRSRRHSNMVVTRPTPNNRLSPIFPKQLQSGGKLEKAPTSNSTQQTDQALDKLSAAQRQKRAIISSPVRVAHGKLYGDSVDDANQAPDDNQIRPSSSERYNSPPAEQNQGPAYDSNPNSDTGLLETDSSLSSPLTAHHQSTEQTYDDWTGKRILSILDHGLYDGIKRVIFGRTNHLWLDRILLLDSIEHLSSGEIMTPLERFIQIDIDDIFVGERGTRLKRNDVEALIETQRQFAAIIEGGFKFNLGFSGKYFKHGNELEQEGDEFLVKRADEFTWFCHFWSHSKAHLFNDTNSVANELKSNLKFAQENELTLIGHTKGLRYDSGVPLPPTYAVAPHHSGVYPMHEQLYDAWRTILNVKVTSTEEYPHLRPATGRRGFVHKSIKVLPRQTCGLYTHTIFRHKYPGGISKLINSIRGGELFETILHNPVNIYMSHMSNYANDRLAPYTFKALFEFVQEYTNLRLKYAPSDGALVGALNTSGGTASDSASSEGNLKDDSDVDNQVQPAPLDIAQLGPLQLADYYFSLYPHEREPLYTNPCNDKRHMAIWSVEKHKLCQVVPSILIVGPQKTGTTALHSFLKMNPTFKTSIMSETDFEEVQFFNDKHYWRGSDWYFSRFLEASNSSSTTSSSNNNNRHNGSQFEKASDSNSIDLIEKFKGKDSVESASGDDYYNTAETPFSFYLDKSATYFDDPNVVRRASSLLPDAFIIILLIDPADRAYSWYQHNKAHGDLVANEFTFDEIIMHDNLIETAIGASTSMSTTNRTSSKTKQSKVATGAAIRALRQRCLHPGYYSSHLSNWLAYYPSRRIIIIDGQWFKYNPIAVLNRLQLLLRVPKPVDYANLLEYSEQKGFYCEKVVQQNQSLSSTDEQQQNGQHYKNGRRRRRNHHQKQQPHLKCLGSGKGRHYEPMSREARSYLTNHYWEHNRQLARLLYEIGQPLPTWLDDSINQQLVSTQRERQVAPPPPPPVPTAA